MTMEEKDGRYRDYRRGWRDGSRGRLLLGTPEPKYRDEYDRGLEEGAAAFDKAMKDRFDSLNSKG